MKKILKRTGKIFCLFLLIVVLVNILSPLFCRKPDETYVESLRKTEFTSETAGGWRSKYFYLLLFFGIHALSVTEDIFLQKL